MGIYGNVGSLKFSKELKSNLKKKEFYKLDTKYFKGKYSLKINFINFVEDVILDERKGKSVNYDKEMEIHNFPSKRDNWIEDRKYALYAMDKSDRKELCKWRGIEENELLTLLEVL